MNEQIKKEDIKLLKQHAHLVWGGIPHDIEWALNTLVWKKYCDTNLLVSAV